MGCGGGICGRLPGRPVLLPLPVPAAWLRSARWRQPPANRSLRWPGAPSAPAPVGLAMSAPLGRSCGGRGARRSRGAEQRGVSHADRGPAAQAPFASAADQRAPSRVCACACVYARVCRSQECTRQSRAALRGAKRSSQGAGVLSGGCGCPAAAGRLWMSGGRRGSRGWKVTVQTEGA